MFAAHAGFKSVVVELKAMLRLELKGVAYSYSEMFKCCAVPQRRGQARLVSIEHVSSH